MSRPKSFKAILMQSPSRTALGWWIRHIYEQSSSKVLQSVMV